MDEGRGTVGAGLVPARIKGNHKGCPYGVRCVTLATLILANVVILSALAEEWREFKSDHFITCYKDDAGFAKEVSYSAEKYYTEIADELGFTRYSSFWKWEDRVKIYVYTDPASYSASGPYPAWSYGVADYGKKAIFTYQGSEEFLRSTLPHEITHLIFRDYVGITNKSIPLWLDEGVAQWSEPEKRRLVKAAIKYIRDNGTLLTLEKFMSVNIMNETNKDRVRDYYIQAMSLVDFLITEYGSDRFISFCRYLRDGKDMNESLKFAYPVSIRNVVELEKEWRERYVEKL